MMTHVNMATAAELRTTYWRTRRRHRHERVAALVRLRALPGADGDAVGGTLVLERSFAFPAQTLKRIEQEQVTVFPGVPTVYATLVSMKTTPPSTRASAA